MQRAVPITAASRTLAFRSRARASARRVGAFLFLFAFTVGIAAGATGNTCRRIVGDDSAGAAEVGTLHQHAAVGDASTVSATACTTVPGAPTAVDGEREAVRSREASGTGVATLLGADSSPPLRRPPRLG